MHIIYFTLCILHLNYINGQYEDDNTYEIIWANDVHLDLKDDIHKEGEGVHIKTLSNEDYNCRLNTESFHKNRSISDVDSPLPHMENLFIQTICSYKIENYWIYELCHGKHFRQYHEEKSSDPQGPVNKQEYVLGKFPKQLTYQYANGSIHSIKTHRDPLLIFNELLLTAEEILDKINQRTKKLTESIDLESGDSNATQKINAKIIRTAMNLESSVKTYLRIDLDEGTYCDLKKGNRTTALFYFCDTQGLNQIHYLAETSTCEYQLFVATALLCSHPDFSPKSTLVPIHCYATNFNTKRDAQRFEDGDLLDIPNLPSTPTQGIKPKALLDLEKEEFEHYINSQISKVSSYNMATRHGSSSKITSKFKEYEKLKNNEVRPASSISGSGTRKTVTSSRIGNSNIVKIEIKIENEPDEVKAPRPVPPPDANRGDEESHGALKGSTLKGELEAKHAGPRKISEKEEAFLKDIATSTGKISHKILFLDEDVAQKFIDGEFCVKGGGLGWWKYELCLWKHLVQYHESPDLADEDGSTTYNDDEFTKSSDGIALSSAKPKLTIFLGRWEPATHLKWLVQNNLQSLKKDLKSRNKITYFYSNGDYCEEIKANRQAIIKLRCVKMENNPNYISMYLSETSTCSYILSVDSPLVCALLENVEAVGLRNP